MCTAAPGKGVRKGGAPRAASTFYFRITDAKLLFRLKAARAFLIINVITRHGSEQMNVPQSKARIKR